MTLQQLRYAIEIANRGSMNEAAKNLYISQPSLSNAIRELEQEIGSDIFVRTNRGISVTIEGKEFLSYAIQVVDQAELLEEHYLGAKVTKQKFGISTQHYVFAITAFAALMQRVNPEEFDFTFRETTVNEVIEDLRKRKSEIGILYMNQFNALTIQKKLEEAELVFAELFQSDSYVFVTSSHPLAKRDVVRLRDLKSYTYVSFGKGEYNSHYFVEEMLNILEHRKNIQVSDRSTLFYLLRKLGGFTICTGMVGKELHGDDIVAIPLDVEGRIRVGTIVHKNGTLSETGRVYMELLRESVESLL